MWAEKEWINDEVMDHIHMQSHQKIKHVLNHYELTRKDLNDKEFEELKKYQKKNVKQGKLSYNVFPQTYLLSSEQPIFNEEFIKSKAITKNAWILKPIGKSQGRGIFLFNKIQQISSWKNQVKYNPENPSAESYIVQRYIADLLLIGGKKFDT